MNVFENVRELTILSVCLRIFVSVVLGGIIGLERGIKHRAAGLRTYMLVSLGACIVMITNQYVFQVYHTGDLVRMGAQVISGIGFLGAGTIIVTSHNQIKGLTTAAGLWASACDGLAIGIGLYEVAIPAAVMIFIILYGLQKLDLRLQKKAKVLEVYIELNNQILLGDFLRHIREKGIVPNNIQLESGISSGNTVAFIVTLKGNRQQSHKEILELVRKMQGISYLEEL